MFIISYYIILYYIILYYIVLYHINFRASARGPDWPSRRVGPGVVRPLLCLGGFNRESGQISNQ